MTPEELRALSLRLEEFSGHDSIPTIEEKYDQTPRGAYRCAFDQPGAPGCAFVHRDPVMMWKHLHFGQKHGPSWVYCRTPEQAAFRLNAGSLKPSPMKARER